MLGDATTIVRMCKSTPFPPRESENTLQMISLVLLKRAVVHLYWLFLLPVLGVFNFAIFR